MKLRPLKQLCLEPLWDLPRLALSLRERNLPGNVPCGWRRFKAETMGKRIPRGII